MMLYAALHLFTSKGFKETSVLEIVETARVSKTTFY
ncbi:TetR family transcriptional regulator [Fictibacillus sp. WQ 8-8]